MASDQAAGAKGVAHERAAQGVDGLLFTARCPPSVVRGQDDLAHRWSAVVFELQVEGVQRSSEREPRVGGEGDAQRLARADSVGQGEVEGLDVRVRRRCGVSGERELVLVDGAQQQSGGFTSDPPPMTARASIFSRLAMAGVR
jgi:hypothetical protein